MEMEGSMMENGKMENKMEKVKLYITNFLRIRNINLLSSLFYAYKNKYFFFVGIFFYSDETKYEGKWKNGKREGKGKLILH